MKVLIADCSTMVIDRFLTMLREIPNVELLTPTRNAEATIESVREDSPDVLIIDVRLPGAEKLELHQAIRLERPNLVMIVLTNLAYPEYRQRLEAVGADIFMDKSRDFVRLFQILRELALNSFPGNKSASKGGIRKRLAASKLKAGLQLCLSAWVV